MLIVILLTKQSYNLAYPSKLFSYFISYKNDNQCFWKKKWAYHQFKFNVAPNNTTWWAFPHETTWKIGSFCMGMKGEVIWLLSLTQQKAIIRVWLSYCVSKLKAIYDCNNNNMGSVEAIILTRQHQHVPIIRRLEVDRNL